MIYPCSDPATWGPSLDAAVHAVQRGEVVVLPTDTVYGVGADAFSPGAVAAVLAAKGRSRQMPPPVLIPDISTVDGLAREVPDAARALMERFWPGPLTVIVLSQPSLAWDLGDTHGTVALRVPDHGAARALLSRTGPLAVTSANRTGEPAAITAADAEAQLGTAVAVYLDGGTSPLGQASTIVDATDLAGLRIVREGGVSRADVVGVVGEDALWRDTEDAASGADAAHRPEPADSAKAQADDQAGADAEGEGESRP